MTANHPGVASLGPAETPPSGHPRPPRRPRHLLPFFRVAHIGYLPGERIIGLSKLGPVVEFFSRDLQIQERLTAQIPDWLERELEPKGVGVVLEAEHLCMSLRGVQKLGSKSVTSGLRGLVRDDPHTRQEFLALTTRSSHEQ